MSGPGKLTKSDGGPLPPEQIARLRMLIELLDHQYGRRRPGEFSVDFLAAVDASHDAFFIQTAVDLLALWRKVDSDLPVPGMGGATLVQAILSAGGQRLAEALDGLR